MSLYTRTLLSPFINTRVKDIFEIKIINYFATIFFSRFLSIIYAFLERKLYVRPVEKVEVLRIYTVPNASL